MNKTDMFPALKELTFSREKWQIISHSTEIVDMIILDNDKGF